GGPVTVLAQGLQFTPSLALGSDQLYLLDNGITGAACNPPASIYSLPTSGGAMQLIAGGFYEVGQPATSGTTLAFTAKLAPDGCDGDPPKNPTVVFRIEGNGPAQQLDSGNYPNAIATDGTD